MFPPLVKTNLGKMLRMDSSIVWLQGIQEPTVLEPLHPGHSQLLLSSGGEQVEQEKQSGGKQHIQQLPLKAGDTS